MAYSYISYAGNGVATQYAVPFPYIRKEHVNAQVAAVNTSFTWVNASTIQFAVAPGNGVEVLIRRVTPLAAALVDFTDGSSLVASDLDTSNLQHLYAEQELSDAVGPLSDVRGLYYGAYAVDPLVDPYGLPPDAGDQYFNTSTKTLRVYNGLSWQDALPNVTIVRWVKTAAGGETSLSGLDANNVTLAYTAGFEQVYLNGALLSRGTDYVATNGSTITGLTALTASDVVEVLAYSAASIAIPTLALNNGTAAAPSISFASDADTGIYRPGANELGLTTGGVLALSLDAAGNGAFRAGVSGTAGTFSGPVSGTTGTFSGAVSGTTGTFSSAVSGTTGTFSSGVSATTGTFSSAVSGTTGTFSGGVSGTTGTFSAAVSGTTGTFSGAVSDGDGNLRDVPQNSKTGAYTLLVSDAGKHISITTGGVTVPAGVFAIGDAVTIYNNSTSNQTITQGASVTLRQAGTANTGNRTLGQYGLATLLCVSADTFVISGGGLS
jgi:hypothetical protein